MSGSITITSKSKSNNGMDWDASVTVVITPSSGCQLADMQPTPYLQIFNSSNVQIGSSVDFTRQDSQPLTQPTTWSASASAMYEEPASFKVSCWFLDANATTIPDNF